MTPKEELIKVKLNEKQHSRKRDGMTEVAMSPEQSFGPPVGVHPEVNCVVRMQGMEYEISVSSLNMTRKNEIHPFGTAMVVPSTPARTEVSIEGVVISMKNQK